MLRLFIYQILTIGFIFSLFGCQQQEETNLAEQNDHGGMLHVKNSDPVELENYSNEEIAQRLANLAGGVPNVENATAIVAGPYAVVGIDVDKDLNQSRVGTIKYSVAEALQHDPYGKTAVVVADADGTQRIREMANKVQQGHPIQGFVDEVAGIVGRYMPEFPINEDQPQEPDQNKGSIPEDEEKQLEEIQEDQSKNNINN
ncbi:YhcN/YlaJ family sporulation lipoprotein [Aquibacillus halophilus]|uniref:YhcN/YlaJ family sporulation lipoprotein n=1 Tax=Aquibacillus halophilus TaxID=930132 RepID=A0A6A8DKY6_9BACI|nr:YhcN/YlaJ family sporulation lipoprotein [Aquibacillus halophilus]MRH41902.1 YhcN/YlaJ family sporulation lipoprotein [Aquibacillus halophilus]